MQAPLPRRSKGPSAIAAASAAVAGPDSGSEDGSEPRPEPEAPTPPMSAAAAAFVVEEPADPATSAQPVNPPNPLKTAKTANTGTPAGPTTSAKPASPARSTVTPPGRAASHAAEAAPPSPAGRRLPRVALLAGGIVVGAAVIGGAVVVAGAGDDDGRASASPPSAVPGTAQGGGPSGSEPSRPGSASPSVPLSASPTAKSTSAPKSPASEPAKDSGAGAPVQVEPSATVAADDGGSAGNGSDSGDADTSCTPTAGSGAMTGYFVCASAGTVRLQVTFHTSERFLHAFFDTDGNTATGYQLPSPSPSALGADYMIENGVLYRSLSTSWKWSEIAARPTETVSGSTYTWTLPLSRLGSPTGTQRVQFNAGTDFTPVLTFSPK